MEQFDTREKALELFKKSNCAGNENCCFVALKDVGRLTKVAVVGPVGVISNKDFPYDGVLVNKTENGIAVQYLKNKKPFALMAKLENFEVLEGECYFINNSDIVELTVKNHSFLNKKIKSIIIKTRAEAHCLLANVNEPLFPYHNENLAQFANQYSK